MIDNSFPGSAMRTTYDLQSFTPLPGVGGEEAYHALQKAHLRALSSGDHDPTRLLIAVGDLLWANLAEYVECVRGRDLWPQIDVRGESEVILGHMDMEICHNPYLEPWDYGVYVRRIPDEPFFSSRKEEKP